MADNYQEALIKAIETISKSQVDSLATDKTVTATISSCSDLLTNEYKVSYNGGIMSVYGTSGKTYSKGSSVYVLVPEGDFTKKKIIIDSASYKEDDQNISFISSIMNDYNLIGSNTLYEGKDNEGKNRKVYPVGLNSYFRQDAKLIYQKGLTFDETGKNNLLNLDAEELETYMSQADALMIEAKFKTNLPKEHRVRGKYWLDIVIAVKDGDKTVNEFEEYLPNIKLSENEAVISYKEVVEKLKQYWFIEQTQTVEGVEKALKEAKEETNKISNLYQKNLNNNGNSSAEIKAIKDIATALEEFSSIQADNMLEKSKEYIEKLDSKEYVVPKPKYQTFTISSEEMTGDPHRFYDWSNQYIFCPINTSNFLHLESIVFQSEDFVDETNIPLATLKGNNIFVQNIEIYGVRKIEATNGDFKLQVGTPQGAIFYSTDESKTLEILGKTTKADVDISVNTNYYWFVEDMSITSSSSNFNYYAGAGWRWLESTKGNDKSIIIKGSENLSYENRYKCIAAYKQSVILKADITIYNYAVKRKLEIKSDIGTSFSFDRGIPTLTCYVNDKSKNFEEEYPDEDFKFIWSVIEDTKSTITYDKTLDELQKELKEVKDSTINADLKDNEKKIAEKEKANKITALKQRISALEVDGLKFDKNVMRYPISSVNKIANIKCGVFLKFKDEKKYQSIGTASIDLQNNSEATPTEYYILITNGDQVFQYSESGVAPDNERYTDPLEVKPLECHFYDPTGLEVNENTYELKWKVPLSDSMIVTPTQNMAENPATGNKELNISPKKEWYQGRVFPLEIQQSYNYFALNNQVTAIVTYDGREYTQDSKLYFTKIGENGTNGTDIVCKIEPKNNDNINGMLALEFRDNKISWNTGEEINVSAPLEAKAYNRNSLLTIEDRKINWSIAGGGVPKEGSNSGELTVTRSKHLYFPDRNSGIINWIKDNDSASTKFSNQIVKSEIKIKDELTGKDNSYYSYYPIYTIYYNSDTIKNIYIDKTKTLKYITYNANGRNPLFNKNQGISIKIDGEANTNYYIEWTVHGGINDIIDGKGSSSTTSSLKLYQYKEGIYYEDGERKQESPSLIITQETSEEQKNKQIKEYEIYVSPVDIYSGEYCNNLVRARIYSSGDEYKLPNPSVLAEIYIPICLTLNIYGLSSLNAWDGTHIEINEDENYILAPQIGAGEKDSENKFTGIVMGKATTYDKVDSNGKPAENTSVGLLGYAHGKQSIWLDAESGKAVFGLPETQASQDNIYNEGRIELVPGGFSSIGNWKIGSRLLYNIVDDTTKPKNSIRKFGYNDKFTPQLKTGNLVWDKDEKKYHVSDVDTIRSFYSISPEGRGMILSAEPAYISIKGAQLTIEDAKDRDREIRFCPYETDDKATIKNDKGEIVQDYRDGKSELYVGDSLELQLDANRASLFTILQHTKERNSNGETIKIEGGKEIPCSYDEAKWKRIDRVGIDAYGRFYTNALKDNSVGIAPGYVPGFGHNLSEHIYSGLSVEVGESSLASDTIFKAFIRTDSPKNGTLYLSGANGKGGANNPKVEYSRPMHLYGKEISLFVNKGKTNNQEESDDRLTISSDEFYGGNSSNYISVSSKDGLIGAYKYDNQIKVTSNEFFGGNKNQYVQVNRDGFYGGTSINYIKIVNSGSEITTASNLIVNSKGYTNNVGSGLISLTSQAVNILTGGATTSTTSGIKISSPMGVKLNISENCWLNMSGKSISMTASPDNNKFSLNSDGGTFITGLHGDIALNSGATNEGRYGVEIVGNGLSGEGGVIYLNTDAVVCRNNFRANKEVYANNYYWEKDIDATGSENVWDAITKLVNTYNDHTHTVTVQVPGQSRTETVEIEAVSTDDWITVGNYNDLNVWEEIASGYLKKPIKVSKEVTLEVPVQNIDVTLNPPDQQITRDLKD